MTTALTAVWFTTSFEGFHCWPRAPEWCDFLAARHRHLFGVRVEAEVAHLDRDIEFIAAKRELSEWIATQWPGGELGSFSCEMVALAVAGHVRDRYGATRMAVWVDEDGENGARVSVIA